MFEDKQYAVLNMLSAHFLCDTEIDFQNTAFIGEVVTFVKNESDGFRGIVEISWPDGNKLLKIATSLGVCWCKKDQGRCKVTCKLMQYFCIVGQYK